MNPADKDKTKKGTVLQVSKESERLPGCLVIVQDVRSWGVQGYIPTPQGLLYVRVAWNDAAYIGEAPFVWEE
jgi:hypothetical protein